MTGALEDRLEDLEKANEHVAVRMARIKRKFSIDSNSTSSSQASKVKAKDRLRKSKLARSTGTLFQNR